MVNETYSQRILAAVLFALFTVALTPPSDAREAPLHEAVTITGKLSLEKDGRIFISDAAIDGEKIAESHVPLTMGLTVRFNELKKRAVAGAMATLLGDFMEVRVDAKGHSMELRFRVHKLLTTLK
jgi:hypothetical protein